MVKRFDDLKKGDSIYTISVFVIFNGHMDNSENDILSNVVGVFTTLAKYDSSNISTFFVDRMIQESETVKRLVISSDKVYNPLSTHLTTLEVREVNKYNDVIIQRTMGGSIKIFSTTIESLKREYPKVIDALINFESTKMNQKMSSLMELKNKEI